jgi:pyruvate ferredoxin oxidoreductase gamma subunit
MLGAFAALTSEITLEAIDAAIRQRFSGTAGEHNVAAARAAFHFVTLEEEGLTSASTD